MEPFGSWIISDACSSPPPLPSRLSAAACCWPAGYRFLGRLPGDIRIQQDGFACFFPLMTGLLLSIVLTVVLNLIFRARQ
ncbi:MAG: DUF2905 domain-containing protein [Pirellulales bacterium]|nr:DUF2905 domain-containing protein [Pirellulales bacterium]